MRASDLPVRTERLVLRAHRTDDMAALMSYYSDPEVTRYLPWAPWTRQDAELALAKRISRVTVDTPDSALGLVVERDGQVIGDVVLWPADDTLLLGELGSTASSSVCSATSGNTRTRSPSRLRHDGDPGTGTGCSGHMSDGGPGLPSPSAE